jgi:carnitine O-acetyltransferase
LEDYIGGPLYQHQHSLPRLPVPTVQETLQKFVPTALPLATNNNNNNALEEREHLLQAVEKFASQSLHLQQRLQERAANDGEYRNSSWLQHWWNTWGYLDVRDPVTINVSYFFHLADDSRATTNAERGAAILQAAALYRQGVCSGSMPAERIGKGDKMKVLDSTAFKYMFHACRIPQRDQDAYEIHDPSMHRHVLVVRNGQFFVLDFCDQRGTPYSLATLEQGLQEVIQRADLNNNNNNNNQQQQQQPELGWLTSSNRDDWATARQDLLQVPGARAALDLLESAALCLCLDNASPVSKRECAVQFWHGSSEGRNRWMDKSVQIVVTNNGKAGLVGEHSM